MKLRMSDTNLFEVSVLLRMRSPASSKATPAAATYKMTLS